MVMGEDVGHYGGSYKARPGGRRACPLARLAHASQWRARGWGADRTRGTQVTYDLYKKYGEFRLLDTPICEYSFMVRVPRAACSAQCTLADAHTLWRRRAWAWGRR
jgi:pyruvate/2-oxoglutarate/acetoin dehydrogenase E1 component